MEERKLEIRWIGYCEETNKIWGWFVDLNRERNKQRYGLSEHYCFWSVLGKTISMNKHTRAMYYLDELQKKKIKNKYVEISQEKLIEMWPDFHENLNNRLLLLILTGAD